MIPNSVITNMFFIILYQIIPSEPQFRSLILERQTLQSYCRSFKTCNDCKNGAFQCEWCHEVGCTNFPRLHCPKKFYLDSILKRDKMERFCTEIVTASPVFVPANIKQVIKLDLRIDDMTLYERDIVCEFRLGSSIMQVKGSLDKNAVLCEAISLEVQSSVGLGYVRLVWGGVEPNSNVILLIVYNCKHLAKNCIGCQALNKEFQCGWCKDTSTCNMIEECPRKYGPWIDRNYTCERYESLAFTQFQHQRSLWH